ncbi:MAG: acyltransferase family protein [Novosphingobium sp.]
MPPSAPQPRNYRPEIDGLRAVAVIGVMLFHAGVPELAGGYLGVDIFFVISGYLITGIVAQGGGHLSLGSFYMRRIRRIVPALLLTFALVTPFAWALLLPDGLENYGQSLFASAAMANNLLLYLTGGYWDIAAELKPLMHTWSLGVEEQYYLLLVPAMLWLARRGSASLLRRALAGLALGSLALAVWLGTINPALDFLILPTRAWELALGGMVALAQRRPSAAAASLGLAAAIVPMTLYGIDQSAPGLATLAPVGGSALFLWTATSTAGPGRLLAARLPVAIGLASYSAYLFHQPLFALLRAVSFSEPAPWRLALWLPPVLAAAWMSWRWIESPARDPQRFGDRAVLIACGTGTAVATALGLVLHLHAGFASRWPELAGVGPGGNIAYVDGVRRLAATRLDPAQRETNVIVIGHSQARDFINMGLASGKLSETQIRYVEVNLCTSVLPLDAGAAAREADWVVFSIGLNGVSARCLMGWSEQLRAAGVSHVLVLGPKQFGFSNAAAMRLPAAERYALKVPPRPRELDADAEVRAVVPPAQFIDLFALLGDDRGRMPVFTPDRRFITQDGRHLTPGGAKWLGEVVFAQPQLSRLKRR